MSKQIYYEILSKGDNYKLVSVVWTNFGGYATNFVKNSGIELFAGQTDKAVHDYIKQMKEN